MTNNNGVPVYAHAIVAEVADKLATMTDSELADMARRLVAQDAPRAERLVDAVTMALAVRMAEQKPVE